MTIRRLISLGVILISWYPLGAAADDDPVDDASAMVSYSRDVRPIFQAHCHGCHQPSKRGGDYVMTNRDELLSGGESGDAAIVPGAPDESYLIAQIAPDGDTAAMPKDRPMLGDAERALIRQWIEQGALDDSPTSSRRRYDREHPPEYSAAPVITSLDFSPDGTLLAVSGYHEVVLHQADGGGVVARLVGLSERIESAVFSPDGKFLAVTGGSPGRMGELQIWDIAERELVLSLPVGYDTCYGASWSPDGKLIGFGCPDNTIRAVDPETAEQKLFNGAHSDWVLDTVFSAQGSHLISVSRDRSMKLIEVATQRFVDNITSITPGALKGGLNAVDRHPTKDELLAGGADGSPKIYRMLRDKDRKIGDDFNLIRAFPALSGRIFCVAFNHDGSRIAAGSSFNGAGEVQVYHTADAKVVFQQKIEEGGIFAIDFSPDGKVIAAGGFDGTVRLMDAATGDALTSFHPIELRAVSPARQSPKSDDSQQSQDR